MKKIVLAIAAIILVITSPARAQSTISHSAITFKIKNLGITTGGLIAGLQADVHFNPADMAGSKITASVDVNTLNTDNDSRDEHLKSEDFFDVVRYPKITLKSVSFTHTGADKYSGKFNLTLKNKTKQVEIPFTFTVKNGVNIFNGSFQINRREYGVGENSFTLSDDVTIFIEMETK